MPSGDAQRRDRTTGAAALRMRDAVCFLILLAVDTAGPVLSSPTFRHVLLTRFNLATPGPKQRRIRLQPGWLDDRFELFERYCLPTIATQSVRTVDWLVFFDRETPSAYRDRIDRLRREVAPFTPVYTGMFDTAGWMRAIADRVEPADFLVTTRLDNDDGLAVDAIERLQAAFRPSPASLNFPEGFVICGSRAYRHRHESNAFVSLLEPWSEAVTVHAIDHLNIGEVAPLRQVPGPGAWLQVVHGDNVSNRIRGSRVQPRELENRFPPSATAGLEPASRATIALENGVVSPLRRLRDHAIDVVRGRRRISVS